MKKIFIFLLFLYGFVWSRGVYFRVGDTYEYITNKLGAPEEIKDYGDSFQVLYRKTLGIDFLMDKNSGRCKEIRLNVGYPLKIEGCKIFDPIEKIFRIFGYPKSEYYCTKEQASKCFMGGDRVLYKLYNGSKKYVIQKEGILFWFNNENEVIQIVVYKPYNKDIYLPLD